MFDASTLHQLSLFVHTFDYVLSLGLYIMLIELPLFVHTFD